MGTKLEEIIKGIHVVDSNLEYIAKTGRINGSLYLSIQQAMQEYATECVKASLEKAAYSGKVITSSSPSEGSGSGSNNTFYYHEIDKQSITSPDNIVLL